MVGCSGATISHIETFQQYPTDMLRTRLSEVTGIPDDQLFPAWLREWANGPKVARTEHEVTQEMLSAPQFLALPSGQDVESDAIHDVDLAMLPGVLGDVLTDLSERERLIVTRRFGLDGQEPMTIKDLAVRLGLTSARIVQIEAAALRKLRSGKAGWRLRPHLDGYDRRGRPAHRHDDPYAFWSWLMRHRATRSEIGLLARTLAMTPCCRTSWSISALRRHLDAEHGSTTRLDVAWDMAVMEYRRYLRTARVPA